MQKSKPLDNCQAITRQLSSQCATTVKRLRDNCQAIESPASLGINLGIKKDNQEWKPLNCLIVKSFDFVARPRIELGTS